MPKRRRKQSNSFVSKLVKQEMVVKITKITGLIVVLILALLIGYGMYRYRNVEQKEYARFQFVILEPNQSVKLVILDPKQQKISTIFIPGEVSIPVVHGYGRYRLEVVDDLGYQEGYKLQLLIDSLGHWIGIDINAAIISSSTDNYQLGTLLTSKSSLTIWEKIWLWSAMQSVPHASREEVDMLENEYLTADDAGQLILTTKQQQRLIEDYVKNEVLTSENHQLVIVNTTSIPGLATNATQTLQNLGYDVVAIQEQQTNLPKTKLLVDPQSIPTDEYLRPLKTLFFGVPDQIEPVYQDYRGDIVLLLGQDYGSLLYGN